MDTTTAASAYSPCSLPDLLASFSQTFCNSTLCFEETLLALPPHLFVRTFLESARTFANNPLPPQTTPMKIIPPPSPLHPPRRLPPPLRDLKTPSSPSSLIS